MNPDFRNHPLTAEQFEKLPTTLIPGEYWEPVWNSKKHIIIDSSESWSNPIKLVFEDSMELIGFIGVKTGIRLSPECADLIEVNEE